MSNLLATPTNPISINHGRKGAKGTGEMPTLDATKHFERALPLLLSESEIRGCWPGMPSLCRAEPQLDFDPMPLPPGYLDLKPEG